MMKTDKHVKMKFQLSSHISSLFVEHLQSNRLQVLNSNSDDVARIETKRYKLLPAKADEWARIFHQMALLQLCMLVYVFQS